MGDNEYSDQDNHGMYFASSIRQGPFMKKQEDRVSINSN